MKKYTIAHMYPDLMNLYGDRGNLICLQQRMHWYGLEGEIKSIHLQDKLDFNEIDMLFMGGGSDREQGLVYHDLIQKSDQLLEQINHGLPVLCICGAYQLLGAYYKSHEGKTMDGLGFFPFYTVGRPGRLIGNILIESEINGQRTTIVGFENHGGRTYFNDEKLQSLGKVVKGYGNNGEDRMEGMLYQNLIGTYLHGPLLPKNPELADFFIRAMTFRRGEQLTRRLDDTIEQIAHAQVIKKIMNGKK
ncbi:MAG: glutamine amidotransferase [Syntrophomonadaceae bacterium]|nr:glutamine amidotransferase [Syntrophomonadaceae bacterium]